MVFPIKNFLPDQFDPKDKTITFCFKQVTHITWTSRLLNMAHIAYASQFYALSMSSSK